MWQPTVTISAYTSALSRGTNNVTGYFGVAYQTATAHAVSGYYGTTT